MVKSRFVIFFSLFFFSLFVFQFVLLEVNCVDDQKEIEVLPKTSLEKVVFPYNVSSVGGGYEFIDLNNTVNQDGNVSSCFIETHTNSDYLTFANFSIDLVAGNYIVLGIQVYIFDNGTRATYKEVQLISANHTVGDEQINEAIVDVGDDSNMWYKFGADDYNWNTGITTEDFNDPWFGIQFSYTWIGTKPTPECHIHVNHMFMVIEYGLPLPPTYGNIIEVFDPMELGGTFYVSIDCFSIIDINCLIDFEGINYTMDHVGPDTWAYDRFRPDHAGFYNYTIYVQTYYHTVFTEQSFMVVSVGEMYLMVFILVFLMGLMLYLFEKKEKDVMLILFLFSVVIGVLSLVNFNIPFSPYFQVFFLMFQSILIVLVNMNK